MIIQQKVYDGSLIHKRFAYEHFREKVLATGNIVAFVAPMQVETDFMVDVEDRLANDFIYSEKAINFCYELPLTNLYGGICFQRLYNSMLADILAKSIEADIEVDGDDIMVCKEFTQGGVTQLRGKASVSIVCERGGVVLGHTGINITAGKKAPAFAYSTNMTDEQANAFMKQSIEAFYRTTMDVFVASTKTI